MTNKSTHDDSTLPHADHLSDYIELLQSHDWSHEFSDDHRQYLRGYGQLQRLRTMQRQLDADYALWNQFCHEKCKDGRAYS